MNLDDFFHAVEAHPALVGIAIDKSGDEPRFAVQHTASKLVTMVPATTVESTAWSVLEEVLTGVREPNVLYHMTRVVGYYSRVENWNKSKLGELKDRRAGQYAVAES